MSRASHDTEEGRAYLQLRALAKANGRTTSEYLQLFALEGFAARISLSDYRDQLVLKGGLLMSAFNQRRPTRDVDLLALGIGGDEKTTRDVVREVLSASLVDGLEFAGGLRSRAIREDDVYAGVRVSVDARLATARVSFHVDINVGDPVVPPPGLTELPRLFAESPFAYSAIPLRWWSRRRWSPPSNAEAQTHAGGTSPTCTCSSGAPRSTQNMRRARSAGWPPTEASAWKRSQR